MARPNFPLHTIAAKPKLSNNEEQGRISMRLVYWANDLSLPVPFVLL